MSTCRCSKEQSIVALRQQKSGTLVAKNCRRLEITRRLTIAERGGSGILELAAGTTLSTRGEPEAQVAGCGSQSG